MSKRTNAAVMARRIEDPDALDLFPTPPWATRALPEIVLGFPPVFVDALIWEPADGLGHMSGVLREYGAQVCASDCFAHRPDTAVVDFLHPDADRFLDGHRPDWIITNPPYNRALDFVLLALKRATLGVAMLTRTGFLEGGDRWRKLYRERPPTIVAHFAERVPMHKGRWVTNGKSATAYCWLVWMGDELPRPPVWVPPGARKRLTRHDDWLRFGACSDLPKAHPAMTGASRAG